MTTIAVVDYGMGNRRSVEKALERAGAKVLVSADHDTLRAADGLVLPGVGAFPEAMRRLREAGLDEVLTERARPLIGLCLGMQLLFERSSEHEGATGLGLLPGAVERLEAGGMKLPHIGWNAVRWTREHALVEGLPDPAAFYHVHSYVVTSREHVLGEGDYGGPFVSVVAAGDVFGTQFHPEKSSAHGLALLRNFAGICARREVAAQ